MGMEAGALDGVGACAGCAFGALAVEAAQARVRQHSSSATQDCVIGLVKDKAFHCTEHKLDRLSVTPAQCAHAGELLGSGPWPRAGKPLIC
jgi:hypothetical protein